MRPLSKKLLDDAEEAAANGIYQHALRSGEQVPMWGTGNNAVQALKSASPLSLATQSTIMGLFCLAVVLFKGIFEGAPRFAADRHLLFFLNGAVVYACQGTDVW